MFFFYKYYHSSDSVNYYHYNYYFLCWNTTNANYSLNQNPDQTQSSDSHNFDGLQNENDPKVGTSFAPDSDIPHGTIRRIILLFIRQRNRQPCVERQ